MSCKCLRCLRRVGTRLHHAGASAGSGRLGGSVSHFELQKHESSFKPALFTALIGCGGAQSSECTACFPKMLKNQQRFHWHATKWHRQYSSCCYDYSSHLHVLMAVPYKQRGFTLLKLANYVNGTDRISTLVLSFLRVQPHMPLPPLLNVDHWN